MTYDALSLALAIATSASRPNSVYTEQKEKQRREHEKALTKKQRIREQIRARREERKIAQNTKGL